MTGDAVEIWQRQDKIYLCTSGHFSLDKPDAYCPIEIIKRNDEVFVTIHDERKTKSKIEFDYITEPKADRIELKRENVRVVKE